MTDTTDKCIYCSRAIDSKRGEGDHVIPAALGRFRDDLRFRRICRDCNGRLGKLEETLLRSAPEAFFRRIVQPVVKRRKRGDKWVAAQGGARPKFLRKHPDHTELVEVCADDPRNVTPIDQLVIISPKTGEHHIRLFPAMTAAQLRAKIDALDLQPSERSYLHSDEANWDHYVRILREVWPDSPIVESESDQAGVHRVLGRTEFRFSAHYWRAIAKIAFHYYLVTTVRGVLGDEPYFEDIRHFITEGGDDTPFFEKPGARFLTPFGKLREGGAILPSVWAHLLAADEERRAAVATVNLFLGPVRLPSSHHVTLGRFSTQLVVPGAQSAHAYIYEPDTADEGFAGRVRVLPVRKLR